MGMRPLLAAMAAGIMQIMVHSPTLAGPASAFEHEFEAIEGGKLPFGQWRGKVLLVVNTASFCGFTPQYEGLQKLWERYEANFHKYLVGRDGKPIAGYGSNVEPLSPELTKAIEAALAKP